MRKQKIKIRPLKSYTPVVAQIGYMNLKDRETPWTWYVQILLPNGEPDHIAIMILTELVYWHIPIRHFNTKGVMDQMCRKFQEPRYSPNYKSWAEKFGYRLSQVILAFERLEKFGLVAFHVQEIKIGNRTIGEITYIEPVPKKLRTITPDLGEATRDDPRESYKRYLKTGQF